MADVKWTDAQLEAIEARNKNILVCAAAGSGKTATLTERIIRRLTDKNDRADISRMIVVTYTRNAANELKEKIRAAVSAALEKDPSDEHLALQLIKLPSARISTIHSFCYDIIKRNAANVGLSSSVRIGDVAENEIRARRIMEEVVADFYDDGYSERSRDFALLAESITDAKNEKEISERFLDVYKMLSSYSQGIDLLRIAASRYIDESSAEFFSTEYGEIYKREIIETAESFILRLSTVSRVLSGEDPCHAYLSALDNDILEFKGLLYATENGYAATKEYLESMSFSTLSSLKKDLATPCSEFVKDTLRIEMKKRINSLKLKDYAYTDEQIAQAAMKSARLAEALAELLYEFEARFQKEKREAGILDYSDLEHFAYKILYDENGKRTDAAREISELTDEIYIDEYQDVNDVQDKLFYAVSNGSNLFMVGDVKQSIYSFRGACPDIFVNRRDAYPRYERESGDTDGALFMQNNFRCDSTVVDFVNDIFSVLLGESAGMFEYLAEDALVFSKNTDTSCETKARIEICESEIKGAGGGDPEAEYVANEIVEMLNSHTNNDGSRIRPKDIAILMRSLKKADKYKRELEKRGVPVMTGTKEDPFDNNETRLVLSLLNSIDNPHRDIHLAAVLLSEIYSFTLDELTLIRAKYPDALSLYDSVCRYSDEYDFEKGKRFIESNKRYRALAKKTPVDKLIRLLYDECSIVKIAVSKYELSYERVKAKKNCMMIFEYARAFESGAYKGLYAFIDYIDNVMTQKLYPESSVDYSGDCVKIMSMHASKGLEFPVCFVCDTNREYNRKDTTPSLLFSEKLGIAMKLRSDDGLALVNTPFRVALARHKRRLMIDEEMRVLYVALTRAREKLIVTMQPSGRFGSYEKMTVEAALGADSFTPSSVFGTKSHAEAVLLAASKANMDVEFSRRIVVSDKNGKTYNKQTDGGAFESRALDEDTIGKAREILNANLGFEYPHRPMTHIRAKMSVSRLYPGVLDEDEGASDSFDPSSFDLSPEFAREGAQMADSAQKGTATHLVMQFANFERMKKTGVREELATLVREGFIDEKSAELVIVKDVEKFLDSSFFARLCNSDKLWREFRFNLLLDASLLAEDEEQKRELQGEQMLVQGVIDGFFAEGDNVVLFDYKTDYLTAQELANEALAQEKLSRRHAQQLCYYKMALTRIFGKDINEVYIYSLPLGKEVKVNITEEMLYKAGFEQ